MSSFLWMLYVAIGLFGVTVLAVVVFRLVRPTFLPNESNNAEVEILGQKIKGPWPAVLGICAIGVAVYMISIHQENELTEDLSDAMEQLSNLTKRNTKLQGTVDSMSVRIQECDTVVDSLTVDHFEVSVVPDTATLLPQLGAGASAIIRKNIEGKSKLKLSNVAGRRQSRDGQLFTDPYSSGRGYFPGESFFVETLDGAVWSVTVKSIGIGSGATLAFVVMKEG